MTAANACRNCGAKLEPQWKLCPLCGVSTPSAPDAPPASDAEPASIVLLTPATEPESALSAARRDRVWIGIGLLILGGLGMIGGTFALFQQSTMDALSVDAMLGYAAGGGGLLLVVVIVGLVLMAPRGGDGASQVGYAVLSTTVSVMLTVGVTGVIGVAAVVYMFNDCLRTCQGRSRPARTSAPPPTPSDAAPRAVEKVPTPEH